MYCAPLAVSSSALLFQLRGNSRHDLADQISVCCVTA